MLQEFRFGAATSFAGLMLLATTALTPAGAQQTKTPPPDTVRVAQVDTVPQADTADQTEDMQQFEARRKRGSGYYLTQQQLQRYPDRPLADIITSHFPGLRSVWSPQLNSEYLVSTRGQGPNALVADGTAHLCYVQIFVDGSFILDGDISWLNPNNLAGVEYYDVTRVPPLYRRQNGVCGVLLAWSKTGG